MSTSALSVSPRFLYTVREYKKNSKQDRHKNTKSDLETFTIFQTWKKNGKRPKNQLAHRTNQQDKRTKTTHMTMRKRDEKK